MYECVGVSKSGGHVHRATEISNHGVGTTRGHRGRRTPEEDPNSISKTREFSKQVTPDKAGRSSQGYNLIIHRVGWGMCGNQLAARLPRSSGDPSPMYLYGPRVQRDHVSTVARSKLSDFEAEESRRVH